MAEEHNQIDDAPIELPKYIFSPAEELRNACKASLRVSQMQGYHVHVDASIKKYEENKPPLASIGWDISYRSECDVQPVTNGKAQFYLSDALMDSADAEMMAFAYGLRALYKSVKDSQEHHNINIYTDHLGIAVMMRKQAVSFGTAQTLYRLAALAMVWLMRDKHRVETYWIPRYLNTEADALSQNGDNFISATEAHQYAACLVAREDICGGDLDELHLACVTLRDLCGLANDMERAYLRTPEHFQSWRLMLVALRSHGFDVNHVEQVRVSMREELYKDRLAFARRLTTLFKERHTEIKRLHKLYRQLPEGSVVV